ncbi:D-glucuronyl C5-epimerase family protein [Lutispora saccharofermentans]|uniref:D-glucuronyl C5-epimerase C-terminal domain-containing protein n=1 Tax=Lutispora saccharofermentans TaxID=3024236 RepID=A0ABT1ND39_9FIRM|nr:D-glucuronyl C5-epimerase family protein [Lutispora saccharofermentans]MCQ1529162.1 hypothetical protein [Lutispora saccharofermentans]
MFGFYNIRNNKIRKYEIAFILISVILISITLAACSDANSVIKGGIVKDDIAMNQTDVNNAEHSVDKNGVPILKIKGVGEVRHPGWVGMYALQYSGNESFYDKEVDKDLTKFQACIKWLEENLEKNSNGDYVWLYKFDSTYNDVNIKAPWYSAFAQAVGIEALVAAYDTDKDIRHLEIAEKASKVLYRDINDGGLLFQKGNDIWFEEIPVPAENPTHVLNGHMRAVIALKKLAIASNNKIIDEWASKGAETLNRWLPKYDNGYWLRYDLNPKKNELLFRFTNPYGYKLADIPIDKITHRDPISGKEAILDVGNSDPEGELRIAGNDWGQIEEIDGRTVRRLKPVVPVSVAEGNDGEMHSPYTYFYLKLPMEWTDNLREDWLELTIEYKDEIQGNLSVQMRSICEGTAFRDLRDGDLLLTGSGKWRQWKIPIRPSDLGFWTGSFYSDKHVLYLKELTKYYDELSAWYNISTAYFNMNSIDLTKIKYVKNNVQEVLKQTPSIPLFSLDKEGAVRQHLAGKRTKFINGMWDGKSECGEPGYSPYTIAIQAIEGSKYFSDNFFMDKSLLNNFSQNYRREYNWITNENVNTISNESAYNWLNKNKVIIKDGYTWRFSFENAYNDVYQKPGWQSAFSQKYIIDAYMKINDKETVKKAAYAYKYPTSVGGISSLDKNNNIWFEEVPNNTHILNAHLTSLVTLNNVYEYLNDSIIGDVYEDGLKSLKKYLYTYDTGYWSKYDHNPKKEILFQIDWISGEKSPAIDTIELLNPQTNTATRVDVGSSNDFAGYPRISGSEWSSVENVDGKTARRFINGYKVNKEPIKNATRHNVYFFGVLPEQKFDDYFDVPSHKLLINYKDDVKGTFSIKAQSISEGNNLEFIPLRNAIVECVGDGKWKTAAITIRPQDLGWYMGSDYQKFHVDQLKLIADITKDWYFEQYTEKWEYYLSQYKNKKPVIEESDSLKLIDISSQVKVINSSPMYDGFEIENSLDGNPNDDYTAGIEGILPQFFILEISNKKEIKEIELIWESESNYGVSYTIEITEKDDKVKYKEDIVNQNGQYQKIILPNNISGEKIKFIINKTNGQNRILLRQIKINVLL